MNVLALVNRRLEEFAFVIILTLGISECSEVDAPQPGEGTTLELPAEPSRGPTPPRAETTVAEIKDFSGTSHEVVWTDADLAPPGHPDQIRFGMACD
jgi:hypothetical protein